MDFLVKLKDIDRRFVFIAIALSVALPMVFKFNFPVAPGRTVQSVFDFVEKLPPGTRAYLSFDYDPASMPELSPAAVAILAHMFRRGVKPICAANWPVGGDMADVALASATHIFMNEKAAGESAGKAELPKVELVKGRDYVNMGYKPGLIVHIKGLIDDFLKPFPIDKDGNSTANMEIFKKTDGSKFTLKDVGIIISFTAGTGGIETFISLGSEHKRQMATSCTSVNIPKFYTYLQTKQLIGMLGGLPGAAEYEALINHSGPAREAMAPQSIAHLVIMLFIIVGNIAFLVEKSKAAKKA